MSLFSRIDALHQRLIGEHEAGKFLFAAVICNGCGRRIAAPTPEKLALRLEGWRLGEDFGSSDYCPRCRGS